MINNEKFNLEITQAIFSIPIESRLVPNVYIYMIKSDLLDIVEFDNLLHLDYENRKTIQQSL